MVTLHYFLVVLVTSVSLVTFFVFAVGWIKEKDRIFNYLIMLFTLMLFLGNIREAVMR